MGDLHSIAYTRCSPYVGCWDIHSLQVPNIDMSFVMDSSPTSFFSSLDSDLSTGYLEDALADFKERSKRTRFQYSDGHHSDHVMRYHNSNVHWDLPGDYNCMRQVTFINEMSDGLERSQRTNSSDKENMDTQFERPEEILSTSSSCKYSEHTMVPSDDKSMALNTRPAPEGHKVDIKKRAVSIKRVVYPFELVKPGGVAGDMTLNDINERILMPPTRPVRHPVGNFACRPCVSADGLGLSGKAVVALTRIQTNGRGTVTIIRTKG